MYERGSMEDWLCVKWLRIRLIWALIPFYFEVEGLMKVPKDNTGP
jgi:hypothetical protein